MRKSIWNARLTAILEWYYSQRCNDRQIAHHMGLSVSCITAKRVHLGLPGHGLGNNNPELLPKRIVNVKDVEALARYKPTQSTPNVSRQWLAIAAQNILHLVDLKRAGHSPTSTELQIPTDDNFLRVDTIGDAGSYLSSPAALCAAVA